MRYIYRYIYLYTYKGLHLKFNSLFEFSLKRQNTPQKMPHQLLLTYQTDFRWYMVFWSSQIAKAFNSLVLVCSCSAPGLLTACPYIVPLISLGFKPVLFIKSHWFNYACFSVKQHTREKYPLVKSSQLQNRQENIILRALWDFQKERTLRLWIIHGISNCHCDVLWVCTDLQHKTYTMCNITTCVNLQISENETSVVYTN